MNNTMKNLKDEIEEILKKHLCCVMRGSDSARLPTSNNTTYKGVTASAFMTSEGIEALTSLIEQEKERAIRKDREAIYKDIKSNYYISADEFFEQYLAERRE